MEDRQAWIADEAHEIADKIGMKLPKIVFREDKIMGYPVPMYVVTTEFTGGLNTRALDEPELRISPGVAESDSEGALRYRLAAALLYGDPARQRSMKRSLETSGWIAALAALGLGGLVYLLSSSAALGITISAASIVGLSLLMTRREMKRQAALPLRAIELTGELEAALALMRSGMEKQPAWAPSFLQRWARRKTQQRIEYIEAEAERRGLCPRYLGDDKAD